MFILSDWAVYLCFTWKRETLCPFIIILSIALFRRVERSPRRTTRKRRKLNIPSPLPWQWLLASLELGWCWGRKYWLLASLTATSSNSLSQARSGPRSAVGSRVSNGKLWREELGNVNILTAVILSLWCKLFHTCVMCNVCNVEHNTRKLFQLSLSLLMEITVTSWLYLATALATTPPSQHYQLFAIITQSSSSKEKNIHFFLTFTISEHFISNFSNRIIDKLTHSLKWNNCGFFQSIFPIESAQKWVDIYIFISCGEK